MMQNGTQPAIRRDVYRAAIPGAEYIVQVNLRRLMERRSHIEFNFLPVERTWSAGYFSAGYFSSNSVSTCSGEVCMT